MTKSTITREQAQKIIVAADEVITALAGTNEDVHPDDSKKMCELWDDLNDRYAPPVVVRELARMALAAMDSEPVAWAWRHLKQWHVTNDEERVRDLVWDGVKVEPLYRHAQPAPVVPEEMTPQQASRSYGGEVRGYRDGWNACRAAMLQAQSSDDGEPTDDERIMAIEGINNCERCGDEGWIVGEMGITRCACSQDGTLTSEDAKQFEPVTTANKLCNSPVIPDTWIPVSERMPEWGDYLVTDGTDFDVQLFNGEEFIPGFIWEDKITHWMPLPAVPPAPAQENI